LFKDFYNGVVDVKRINYGIITLLPKTKEAEKAAVQAHLSPQLFV
jgi:hypothetical protein